MKTNHGHADSGELGAALQKPVELSKGTDMVLDKDKNDVFLAPSKFLLDMEIANFPELEFHFTSEFKTAQV